MHFGGCQVVRAPLLPDFVQATKVCFPFSFADTV